MTQNDLRFYFVERFQELLNRTSIDSYRVKCHNVFSLMKELRSVIGYWLRGYVKQFETVNMCIEETLVAMKEDDIIDYSFYDKQLMIDNLTTLSKSDFNSRGDLGNSAIYLLDKCICSNQDIYLNKLYETINSIIDCEDEIEDNNFKPLADKLSRLSEALACELLNEGFSMSHLYRQSRKLLVNVADFQNAFMKFKQNHGRGVALNSYEVVLKLNGGSNRRLTSISGFTSQLPDDFVPADEVDVKIGKFIESRGALFYRVKVEAHDTAMAITRAVERMGSIVDRAMLGYSILDVTVQKMALVVIDAQPKKVYVSMPVSVMESSYADDPTVVNDMIAKVDAIVSNNFIEQDVRDRLTSALRHLRIGSVDADTGQQLVNYWIALEFIFSSPKAVDSTIPRLEKNLLNVLMCCYAYRRVGYLNNAVHKNGTLADDKDWWKLPDDELDDLISAQTSLLLRHHLQEIKAGLCNHQEDAQKFFSRHQKHLYWQIYRIYRYRNKLIHEAAIVQGLDNVIRCQRFYLVLLLNQFIGYFTETDVKPLSMDSFFYEYTQKRNILDSIIKQHLTGEQRIEKLMKIEVYSELIRQNV